MRLLDEPRFELAGKRALSVRGRQWVRFIGLYMLQVQGEGQNSVEGKMTV